MGVDLSTKKQRGVSSVSEEKTAYFFKASVRPVITRNARH